MIDWIARREAKRERKRRRQARTFGATVLEGKDVTFKIKIDDTVPEDTFKLESIGSLVPPEHIVKSTERVVYEAPFTFTFDATLDKASCDELDRLAETLGVIREDDGTD